MACLRDAVIWKSCGGSGIVQRMNPLTPQSRFFVRGNMNEGQGLHGSRLNYTQCSAAM